MCGIVACVGASRNPEMTFTLMTHLLAETERRGHHATGHLCVTNRNRLDHFKAPIPAKKYVALFPWRRLARTHSKILICHARWATKGDVKNNLNNHPFVAENIGIVHNGTLHGFVEDPKKFKDFDLVGDCDSELLLRMLQKSDDVDENIERIFERLGPHGDFVCCGARVNRPNHNAEFLIFRDSGRPARFVDARDVLGQYVFCSTTAIWRDALKAAGLEQALGTLKVHRIGSFESWRIDADTLAVTQRQLPKPRRIPKAKKEEEKKPAATTSYYSDYFGYGSKSYPFGQPTCLDRKGRVMWRHDSPEYYELISHGRAIFD